MILTLPEARGHLLQPGLRARQVLRALSEGRSLMTQSNPQAPHPDGPAPESDRARMARPAQAATAAKTLAASTWFPLLFFFGFILCYWLPFHDPVPHNVKIAVAPPAAAAKVSSQLRRLGTFDIVPEQTARQARARVLGNAATAAYTISGGHAVAYTAKAAGAYLEQAEIPAFTLLAAREHLRLSTVDLVPTASGDANGNSMFYLAVVWNITPYLLIMMLRLTTATRRFTLLTNAGVGAFVSIAGFAIAQGMDMIPASPPAILYGFLITQAVGLTVYALMPYARQYIGGVSVALFVLASVPSSGGAIPYQMVPPFFRWLHPVMPLGNVLDAMRSIFYFHGDDLLRPTLVLCAWIAAAAALAAGSAVLRRRT